MHEIVSDNDAAGSDDVQREASHDSSDSQNVANDNEIDPASANIDKGPVMKAEQDVYKEGNSAKDAKTSQISSAKHVTEVKNVGTKQPEM